MKISVVIPTYNRAVFLTRCIQSVLNQTLQADEIIVVDDGSTDDTKSVLSQFPISYIYQNNQGVSSARNLGILNAKNEWIAFLDSDDCWDEKKLEFHVNVHKHQKELLASYTNEVWIRNNKCIELKTYQQKEHPTFLNSLHLCKIGTSTFFCHKAIFNTIGLFDESLKACEDYDMWLRILEHYPIHFIDKKLTTKYAGHTNQLSFETQLIDTYRIQALEKHLQGKHKKAVIEELILKITILLKGAKKYNNTDILIEYENKLNSLLKPELFEE
jgi:glycosyltransferase involved in cell wall biosynthesis